MTEPLSPERLAEIRARVADIEGGWHIVEDPENLFRVEIHGDGPTRIAVFGEDPDSMDASYPTIENARFAVHATTDVPALLAEVERLQRLVTTTAREAATLARVSAGFEDGPLMQQEYRRQAEHFTEIAKSEQGGATTDQQRELTHCAAVGCHYSEYAEHTTANGWLQTADGRWWCPDDHNIANTTPNPPTTVLNLDHIADANLTGDNQ